MSKPRGPTLWLSSFVGWCDVGLISLLDTHVHCIPLLLGRVECAGGALLLPIVVRWGLI